MYAGRCGTFFVFEDPGFLRQLHRVPRMTSPPLSASPSPIFVLCLVWCFPSPRVCSRLPHAVAGTVKDPKVWEELYKMFLGANYFERAGVATKD